MTQRLSPFTVLVALSLLDCRIPYSAPLLRTLDAFATSLRHPPPFSGSAHTQEGKRMFSSTPTSTTTSTSSISESPLSPLRLHSLSPDPSLYSSMMEEEVDFAPLDLLPYRLHSFPYPPPPFSPTSTASSSSTHLLAHSSPSTLSTHTSLYAPQPLHSRLSSPPPLPALSPPPSSLSPPDPLPCPPSSPSPAAVAVEAKSAGKAVAPTPRAGRVVSCVFCHTSKVKCGGVFPCVRCVKMGRPHLCTEWRSRVQIHNLIRQLESPAPPSPSPSPSISRLLLDGASADGPSKRRRVELLSTASPVAATSALSSRSFSLSRSLSWDPIAFLIHRSPPSHSYVTALPLTCPPRPFYSRCIVRAMIKACTRGGLHASRPQQLLYFLRTHPFLSPDDFETSVHCSAIQERVRHWLEEAEGEDDTSSSFPLSDGAGQCSPPLLRPNDLLSLPFFILPAVRGKKHPAIGQCDGSICQNMCTGARRLRELHPCAFTFTASPLTPLDDTAYNNHPILCLRRLPSDYPTLIDRLTGQFAGHPMTPSPATFQLSWEVQVNRAFERLFGYSQAQVRAMFMQHGWLACYMWLGREEWEGAIQKDLVCEYGGGGDMGASGERGWEGEVGCVDKWGRAFQCVVVKTVEVDEAATTCAVSCNFIARRSMAV